TTSSTYVSDVNADGLMDLVVGGQVLFNHLDANGIPVFTVDSTPTPVPISDGAIDGNGLIEDFESVYQQMIDTFPLHDVFRRCVAPFSGTIRITGSVALLQDPSDERARYQTADGVRASIQRNESQLWFQEIGPDDYSPKTPTGVDAIDVNEGDRIYFRL